MYAYVYTYSTYNTGVIRLYGLIVSWVERLNGTVCVNNCIVNSSAIIR